MKFSEELRRLSSAATAGKWEVESDQQKSAETVYETVRSQDNKVLFDTANSEVMEIGYEDDEYGRTHWDETGRKNFALIAYLRNHADAIVRLVEAAEDDVCKEDRNLYIFQVQQAASDLNKED